MSIPHAQSGLSKVVGASVEKKMWFMLPAIFWPACGLWELITCFLLYTDRPSYALPMAYMFMGGVYSSVTVLVRNTF